MAKRGQVRLNPDKMKGERVETELPEVSVAISEAQRYFSKGARPSTKASQRL